MLKIERRLVEFVEKHMYLLCALLCSLLALYLRKIVVWLHYDGISSYFDMHTNYTQTVTYYVIVRLSQYLPLLPLHSIKWLAGLADFGVAGLVTYLLGREADAAKRLVFYLACLFSPVLYLRGITWGQIDSVAILLLLVGYALYAGEKKENGKYQKWKALLPVIFAVALCPWLLLVVGLYLWRRETRQQDFWWYFLGLITGVFILQLAGTVILQVSWKEGFLSLVRFLTYHPESGVQYADAVEWLLQMLYLSGPVASVLTMVAAGKRKFPYIWAILIQIVTAVLYGAGVFKGIG